MTDRNPAEGKGSSSTDPADVVQEIATTKIPATKPETVQLPKQPGLLNTDELAKAEAAKRAPEEPPSPISHWWAKFNHIYKTRVRTTTVILIVIFFAGLALYGVTTSYYGVAPEPSRNQNRVVQTTSRSEEPVTSTSERPSTSAEPNESPATEPGETSTAPSTSSFLDRLPSLGGTTSSPRTANPSTSGSVPVG